MHVYTYFMPPPHNTVPHLGHPGKEKKVWTGHCSQWNSRTVLSELHIKPDITDRQAEIEWLIMQPAALEHPLNTQTLQHDCVTKYKAYLGCAYLLEERPLFKHTDPLQPQSHGITKSLTSIRTASECFHFSKCGVSLQSGDGFQVKLY